MTTWVLFAALTLAQADNLEQQLEKLFAPLGSETPAVREKARGELRKLAATNRPVMRMLLRDQIREQKDLEVRSALAEAVDATFSLDDVSLEVRFPKDSLTVREAGSTNTRFQLRLRNNDPDDDVVLVKDLGLEVLQPDGKPLPTTLFMGMGILPPGCFLAAGVSYVTVPAGHVLEWEECLAGYKSESRVIKGYEPPQPGTYVLRFTYAFQRAPFRNRCTQRCADHLNVDKPWNRALEGQRTFEVKLLVRAESAEEKEAAARHEKWMADLMDRYRTGKIDASELVQTVQKAKLDHKDTQRVYGVMRERK